MLQDKKLREKRIFTDSTYDTPLAIGIKFREIKRDSKNIDVSKRVCQTTTPVFRVGPVYKNDD